MTKMTNKEAIETILTTHNLETHRQVQQALAEMNIHITQASISRILNNLGALKVHQPDGKICYRIHKGTVVYNKAPSKISRQAIAHHMAERILWNNSLFTILTKPDCGRYIGTYVDDAALPSVAGTLAGGNTLLVIPIDATSPKQTMLDIKSLFPSIYCNF
ncbi:MAG: hypothetical protein OXR68_02355 [Alphaproteobacteria bacterium]|nr:hypothetical protein [Alphaproteobacteria bacterium]